MAHTGTVDTDGHFIINPRNKRIIPNDPIKSIIMQGDHNSERMTFDIARYVDGHDMYECDAIEIHYVNSASGRREETLGVYDVTDKELADDGNTVVFTWLISGNATRYSGPLNFTISFKCIEDGNVVYSWHTDIYTGLVVSRSIDNGSSVVEEYSDILESWRDMFLTRDDLPSLPNNPEDSDDPYAIHYYIDSVKHEYRFPVYKTSNQIVSATLPFVSECVLESGEFRDDLPDEKSWRSGSGSVIHSTKYNPGIKAYGVTYDILFGLANPTITNFVVVFVDGIGYIGCVKPDDNTVYMLTRKKNDGTHAFLTFQRFSYAWNMPLMVDDDSPGDYYSTWSSGHILEKLREKVTSNSKYSPVDKTAFMTQDVGVSSNGRLYTEPGVKINDTSSAKNVTWSANKITQELAGKVSTSEYAPVAKTEDMTQDVGVDADGKLFTAPGGVGSKQFQSVSMTFEAAKKLLIYLQSDVSEVYITAENENNINQSGALYIQAFGTPSFISNAANIKSIVYHATKISEDHFISDFAISSNNPLSVEVQILPRTGAVGPFAISGTSFGLDATAGANEGTTVTVYYR